MKSRNKILLFFSLVLVLALAFSPNTVMAHGNPHQGQTQVCHFLPTNASHPYNIQWIANASLATHLSQNKLDFVAVNGSCANPPPVCQWDSTILSTDPACVPPPVCEYNPALLASDPLCVPPPPAVCEYNPALLASDPLCVPPMPAYKESWVFTYPRIPCVVGCGSNTGTLTLDQMMPKSSDKVIALFWTMSTPCNWLWTDQSLWQGNWVLDSSGQLWEAVSGVPFKVSEDGVMKDAVQGSDGLYRVQLFPGSYVILYSTDGVPVREDGFLVFKYETGLGYLP